MRKHIINTEIPWEMDLFTIHKNTGMGDFVWNEDGVDLHLSEEQKIGGSIKGEMLEYNIKTH